MEQRARPADGGPLKTGRGKPRRPPSPRAGTAGRPRRSAEGPATRERVLAAALEAFAARGFDAARLEDIAEETGIRRSSLLFHFGSKQTLYEEVVRGVFDDLGQALGAGLLAPGGFEERLDQTVRALATFLEERPHAAPLVLRELLDGRGLARPLLLEAGVPLLSRIERFVREEGGLRLRKEAPVRAALLFIFSGLLVRAAAGELKEPLWGKSDRSRAFARLLLVKE